MLLNKSLFSTFNKNIREKGSFLNSIAITTSGAGISVVLSYLMMPIVSRLYTTADYGVFALFFALSNSGKIVSGLNYPSSLVIPKSHKTFLSLVKLCFALTITFTIFNYLLIILGGERLRNLFGIKSLGKFVYLVPLAIALLNTTDVFVNLNIRFKSFKNNALGTIGSKGGNQFLSILYGLFLGSNPLGLILGQLFGSILYLYFLIKDGVLKRLSALRAIKYEDIFRSAKELKNYPIFVFPSNFILRLSSDVPIYLLTLFYGTKATGSFAFAMLILQAPYSVLGNSITPVFLQRANELYFTNLKLLQSFVTKMYYRLLYIGIIPFSTLTVFGDKIFSLVFGKQWELAGTFASIMSLFYLFRLMSTPMKVIFRVVRKEHIILYLNATIAISRVLSLLIGIYYFTLTQTVLLFSAVSLICYYISFIVIFKTMRIKVFKHTLISILLISASLLILIGIRHFTIGLYNIL